jgi:hypothetical protein
VAVEACTAGDGDGSGNSGSGADGSGAGTGTDSGGGGGLTGPGSGSGGNSDCAAVGSEADVGVLPADVILVIDNSGSMTDEASAVQASMNTFVTEITNANIDVHVILISADSGSQQGVCVPAPLGSGSCPNDENLAAGFMHVVDEVGSSNGLSKVTSNYMNYSSFLRPAATKTIGIISDDNASGGSAAAAAFRTAMVDLDPTFQDFTFHGIVAPYDYDDTACFVCGVSMDCETQCDACCGVDPIVGAGCLSFSEEEGTVYKDLADDTAPAGVIGNLCELEFLPVFQQMATAVIGGAQVSCLYDIPDPPAGQTLDYATVNVEYLETPSSTPEIFFNVPGLGDCASDDEWYYDDPSTPSQILLCPDTCTRVQSAADGKINVTFGCATAIK